MEMARRILLVDDSRVNRLVADARLKEAGFEVTSVENGSRALELLEQTDPPPPFDAVLLDIMMPEIDGIEVLRRTRKLWSSIQLPILMATAKDRSEDVVEALRLGANDYVTKPLDVPVLLARLATHLNLRHHHEALRRAQHSLMNAARTESTSLLAAGVAHEIRNPLAQIQMAASGLSSLMTELPEASREPARMSVEIIENAISAADKIVKKLMSASRAQQLELRETDLNLAVGYALDMVSDDIEAAGVTVVPDFDEDSPPVMLAEDEFYQVFIAVVKNALQAMQLAETERRELTVRTKATQLEGVGADEGNRTGRHLRDGDRMTVLQIEDSGPGMSARVLESAFDAFFTTHATGSGTGLGLTVVRKIVELHGGLIRLENRNDGPSGLRVSIYLNNPGNLQIRV